MRVSTNVADMREDPESAARRSSQLLFYEEVNVLDQKAGWFLVSGADGYSGWVREDYLSEFELSGDEVTVTEPTVKVWDDYGDLVGRLSFGTNLRGSFTGGYLAFEAPSGKARRIREGYVKRPGELAEVDLITLSMQFIGIPYLWGGTSAFGFDCSGFVQRLFSYCGKNLPRDTGEQENRGKKLPLDDLRDDFSPLQPADLLFFEGHVGIYLGSGEMIHSSRTLNGVYTTDLNSETDYVKKLRETYLCARRPEGGQMNSPKGDG